MDYNILQNILGGGPIGKMVTEPPTSTLDSYLETPEAKLALKRQALEEQMGRMSEFLTADPNISLQEALEANKPKTKKGKVMGVIGEVLAGLARAPESPQMQRDRQTRADWKSTYDNRQQNIASELQMARQQAGMIDAENKDLFNRHKLKLGEIARTEGLTQKDLDRKLREKIEADKVAVQRQKIAAQIDQAKGLEANRRGLLELKRYETMTPDKIEQIIARQINNGALSVKEGAQLWNEMKQPPKKAAPIPHYDIPVDPANPALGKQRMYGVAPGLAGTSTTTTSSTPELETDGVFKTKKK